VQVIINNDLFNKLVHEIQDIEFEYRKMMNDEFKKVMKNSDREKKESNMQIRS